MLEDARESIIKGPVGVAPEVNKMTKHENNDPPWASNPSQTSPEVQNGGTCGPTKRTCVIQSIKRKIYQLISISHSREVSSKWHFKYSIIGKYDFICRRIYSQDIDQNSKVIAYRETLSVSNYLF